MSAESSRLLVAGGQRIDVGIVEKRVVPIPPGEGLWREGRLVTAVPPLEFPCMLSLIHLLAYLGSDAEVVIGDELWALTVASVHPAVKRAESYAPAPPWSPLAALAMLRLRTLRGRAIVEGRLGMALSFSVSFTQSRGSPPHSQPITC